eukprot:CAMPEP_0180029792 /NCGR_PEP_ID=MMETSP0984-20121128/27015_1 /TAXON_ID=483367 /ORGANISM="non described non described, Strain CCMP 2436" /LENGTH=352 /DNA_ID=CAMNT_0021954789 /DNA_START=113 /DNA_END=1172 /DNA_ORIENTATION=+
MAANVYMFGANAGRALNCAVGVGVACELGGLDALIMYFGEKGEPERAPPPLADRRGAVRHLPRRDEHDRPTVLALFEARDQRDLHAQPVGQRLQRHVVAPRALCLHPQKIVAVARAHDEVSIGFFVLAQLRQCQAAHESMLVLRAPELVGNRSKLAIAVSSTTRSRSPHAASRESSRACARSVSDEEGWYRGSSWNEFSRGTSSSRGSDGREAEPRERSVSSSEGSAPRPSASASGRAPGMGGQDLRQLRAPDGRIAGRATRGGPVEAEIRRRRVAWRLRGRLATQAAQPQHGQPAVVSALVLAVLADAQRSPAPAALRPAALYPAARPTRVLSPPMPRPAPTTFPGYAVLL